MTFPFFFFPSIVSQEAEICLGIPSVRCFLFRSIGFGTESAAALPPVPPPFSRSFPGILGSLLLSAFLLATFFPS